MCLDDPLWSGGGSASEVVVEIMALCTQLDSVLISTHAVSVTELDTWLVFFHTHTHTHTQTHTHKRACARMHTRVHTCTYTQMHVCTHARTHKCTCTRIHTTHACTHPSLPPPPSLSLSLSLPSLPLSLSLSPCTHCFRRSAALKVTLEEG